MRCAIYLRFSESDFKMDDRSIADQRRECEDYARRMGWEVVRVEADPATRAGAHKPGWERIRAAAANGEFDVLLVDEVSRFSRDFFDGMADLGAFVTAGIKLADPHSGITDLEEATGQIAISVKLAIAQSEAREKGRRSRRGLRGRVVNKKSGGGRPPYGFARQPIWSKDKLDRDGRPVREGVEFVVDQDTAPIVRRIFTEYASGASGQGIARALNSDGVPSPRGRTWGPSTLKSILKNPIYAGRYEWGKTARMGKKGAGGRRQQKPSPDAVTCVEDFVPALIDEETLARVAERLAEEKEKYKGHATRGRSAYLLTGLVKCGECGGAVGVTKARSSKRYRCQISRTKGKDACANRVSVVQEVLDAKIVNVVDTIWKDPEQLMALVREHNGRIDAYNDALLAQVRQLEDERTKIQMAVTRLLDAIEDQEDSKLMVRRLRQREAELERLERKIEASREEVAPRLEPRALELQDVVLGEKSIFTGDIAKDRALLTRHVDSITIDAGGNVVVLFKPEGLVELRTPVSFDASSSVLADREDIAKEREAMAILGGVLMPKLEAFAKSRGAELVGFQVMDADDPGGAGSNGGGGERSPRGNGGLGVVTDTSPRGTAGDDDEVSAFVVVTETSPAGSVGKDDSQDGPGGRFVGARGQGRVLPRQLRMIVGNIYDWPGTREGNQRAALEPIDMTAASAGRR